MEIWLSLKGILLILLFTWRAVSAFPCYARTRLAAYRGTQIPYNHTYTGASIYNTVNQFLGIPYAKPPVGTRRFKKTEPMGLIADLYHAETFHSDCPQFAVRHFPWYYSDNHFDNEDCLYLNIWVPVKNSQEFLPLPGVVPVLFWIHGGDFTLGTSRDPLYNGLTLAAEGGVIVVTINYRLGVFGFLTSGTEEAPGNYGMYDILEALKWVSENIAAFGGDPNQVTIAGQGAGAIAVGLLCVSPLARPYFDRVIMQSGSPAYMLADNSTADSVATSQRLAKEVGCANDTHTIDKFPESVVSCLKGKDARNLTSALHSFHPNSSRSFLPRYGDEILPRNAREALIDGNFTTHVQVLIGNNADEGAFQLTSGYPDYFGFFGYPARKINRTVGQSMLNDVFAHFPDPNAVIDHYLGNVSEDAFNTIPKQVYTAMGDWSILCPTVFFAESYSRAGNGVHFYLFTQNPSTSPWRRWMGSVHFEEVKFVFGRPLQETGYTEAEQLLSKLMIYIWSTFVNTGIFWITKWPKYSRENPVYLDLNANIYDPGDQSDRYFEGPHKDNCAFFRSYFGFNSTS